MVAFFVRRQQCIVTVIVSLLPLSLWYSLYICTYLNSSNNRKKSFTLVLQLGIRAGCRRPPPRRPPSAAISGGFLRRDQGSDRLEKRDPTLQLAPPSVVARASTRRFFFSRLPARAAHAPPCQRRKLPLPVLAASSSLPGSVSGFTSRFRQAIWSALECLPLLGVRVCCLALKWPPLDLFFRFPGLQLSLLQS